MSSFDRAPDGRREGPRPSTNGSDWSDPASSSPGTGVVEPTTTDSETSSTAPSTTEPTTTTESTSSSTVTSTSTVDLGEPTNP